MRGDPFYIGPFSGGLNLRDRQLEIEHTHTPGCTNVISGPDGSFSKRKPCVNRINFSGAPVADITSLFFADNATGIPNAFLASIGTKMYVLDVNGGTGAPNSAALVLPNNAQWSWAKGPISGGQGPFYGIAGDGSSVPKYWDGGGGSLTDWTASAGTLEPGFQMVSFKNRMIMYGPTIPSAAAPATALKASKVGDPRNWDTTVQGSDSAWQTGIEPNDGGFITGIMPWKANLIVFKNNTTYLVYDLDTGANRQINGQLGCQNWRSICETPYGLTFLASDGHIYLTDGVKFTKLTDILRDTGSTAKAIFPVPGWPGGFPIGGAFNVVCAFNDDKLYYSDGTNTWVYDFITQGWWFYGSLGLASIAKRPGTNELYGGIKHPPGSEVAVFWQLFTLPTSNAPGNWRDGVSLTGVGGNTYAARFETPPLAPLWFRRRLINDFSFRRRFHAMRAFISGTVNVYYALDGLDVSPTGLVLGATTGNETEAPIETTFYSMGVGNAIRFSFSIIDSNTFAVHPFSLYTHRRLE